MQDWKENLMASTILKEILQETFIPNYLSASCSAQFLMKQHYFGCWSPSGE